MAIVAAILVRAIIELAWVAERIVMRRPLVLIPGAGLVVASLAIVFAQLTGQPTDLVLFSGQDEMGSTLALAPTLSAVALAAVFAFKGLAWSVSLGSFRGGPTFPALFLGMVGGLLVADVFGLPETALVAIGMGAMTVAMLRLPLSSVILAMVITQAGLQAAPVIIVAVVVAYIATEALGARRAAPTTPGPQPSESPSPTDQPA